MKEYGKKIVNGVRCHWKKSFKNCESKPLVENFAQSLQIGEMFRRYKNDGAFTNTNPYFIFVFAQIDFYIF